MQFFFSSIFIQNVELAYINPFYSTALSSSPVVSALGSESDALGF